MQVQFGIDSMAAEWPKSVVCLGSFDGVHLGHQEVIRRAVEEARRRQCPCVLATFDRHPAAILRPDKCPPSVASLGTNLRAFESMGVDAAVVLAFTKELSQTPAQRFFEDVLVGALRATCIVVGHDFAFGHDRQGTTDWLRERIETLVVPPFLLDNQRVSSSTIRQDVLEGRIEEAARKLGRPFEIEGIVVEGDRLGRAIGYPTVNLARASGQAIPLDGVYSGSCSTPFGDYVAAISVGDRPTVNGVRRTIEAFLLDYPDRSLYGHSVVLRFRHRLRGQEKFGSLADLARQIAVDVEQTARLELSHGKP